LDEVGGLDKVAALQQAQLNVGILLWPEFPLLSLTGIVEALRHAGDIGDESRKLLCNWTIMTSGADKVRSSCGIEIAAEAELLDPRQFHCIFVIGGLMRSLEKGARAETAYLRDAHRLGLPVIGVCTGAILLAAAGLVQKAACVHPYHVKDFQGRFPGIKIVSNQDYVWSDGCATVPGGTSIISFMTDLIARHCGDDRASKTVHQMTIPDRDGASAFGRKMALGYSHVEDGRLKRAILLMERAIGTPCGLETIARDVGLSLRQFERLFVKEFGVTPKQYMMAMRLRYARWLLLNTPQSVTEIAFETGFADCSHFVRSFRRAFGLSPGGLRGLPTDDVEELTMQDTTA
jgi:transcriptional regulator GlxA family with amidase domain